MLFYRWIEPTSTLRHLVLGNFKFLFRGYFSLHPGLHSIPKCIAGSAAPRTGSAGGTHFSVARGLPFGKRGPAGLSVLYFTVFHLYYSGLRAYDGVF